MWILFCRSCSVLASLFSSRIASNIYALLSNALGSNKMQAFPYRFYVQIPYSCINRDSRPANALQIWRIFLPLFIVCLSLSSFGACFGDMRLVVATIFNVSTVCKHSEVRVPNEKSIFRSSLSGSAFTGSRIIHLNLFRRVAHSEYSKTEHWK